MLENNEKMIVIQINGTTKGKIPYILHEYRTLTIDRAREEIGLEQERKAIFIPEKLVNFIIE